MAEQEGYELEVTVSLRYKANPKNYIVADNGDDITAYELARKDAANFTEDFDALMNMLADEPDTTVTVAPVLHLE